MSYPNTITAVLICLSSSLSAQIQYRSDRPIQLDSSDPPKLSVPGAVIPGTEQIVLENRVVLDALDLSAAQIQGVRNGSFHMTNFSYGLLSDLAVGDFREAILREAQLFGKFNHSNFRDARLKLATMATDSNFRSANFSDAVLDGANLNGDFPYAEFHNADFTSAKLNGDFVFSEFSDAGFSGAQLNGVFAHADFSGVDFGTATLSGNFLGANLKNSNLSSATMEANLRKPNAFIQTDFTNANLSNMRLRQIDFSTSILRNADLSNTRIDSVSFVGADLRGIDLENAHFKGGSMLGADVRQVDFSKASNVSVDLTAAVYDQFTIFPQTERWIDFNPTAAGMIYRGAIPGDVNLDGWVEFEDFLVIAENFGTTCDEGWFACWQKGDFDNDQRIGFSDFIVQVPYFGQSASIVTATPEPECVIWPVACGLFVIMRQRQNQTS